MRATLLKSTLLNVGAGALTLLLALAGLSGSLSAQKERYAPPASAMKAHPAGAPLPALPYDGYPSSRPMPTVRAVYDFAAKHPEVLRYMPCFCGCDRSAGHRGNHDCFVKSRDAQGRIVEWDSHGLGCAICLDVGKDAMLMFNSGASVASIRAAIDKKYAEAGPPTATVPDPPKVAPKLPPAAAPVAKGTARK